MNRAWGTFKVGVVMLIFLVMYFVPIWALMSIGYDDMRVIAGLHVLAVLFIVFQYVSGKRLALRAVHAQKFESPLHQQMVADLANDMDVPTPELMIGHFGVLNAFAVGRKGNGVIVLSALLVESLDEAETEAVIAHELSHLKSHDTTVMVLGESLDYLLYITKYRIANEVSGLVGALLAGVVVILGTVFRGLVLVPLRLVSRSREYLADEDAAQYTGNPKEVAWALRHIADRNSGREITPAANAVHELCIFNVGSSLIEKILGTHPPIEKRIERLRKMHEDES